MLSFGVAEIWSLQYDIYLKQTITGADNTNLRAQLDISKRYIDFHKTQIQAVKTTFL